MKSSWAGALGVPQFTPTNVLAYRRRSRQGRPHRSLERRARRRSLPSRTTCSKTGWRSDQTWGREVPLPSGGEETLAAPRSARPRAGGRLPQLRKLGRVARARRLASARRAPCRRQRPARAQPTRRAHRRRSRRRPRLSRLPQFLLDHALQPGVSLRALGRPAGRRDRTGELISPCYRRAVEPQPVRVVPPKPARWSAPERIYVIALFALSWALIGALLRTPGSATAGQRLAGHGGILPRLRTVHDQHRLPAAEPRLLLFRPRRASREHPRAGPPARRMDQRARVLPVSVAPAIEGRAAARSRLCGAEQLRAHGRRDLARGLRSTRCSAARYR